MNTEKLENIKNKYLELTKQIALPDVIGTKEWTRLVKEQNALEPIVEAYDLYIQALEDIEGAKHMLFVEKDPEMIELIKEEIASKRELVDEVSARLKVLLLPKNPDDEKDVIIEIRAGAGGDEASLFGYQLMRMYRMFAEGKRFAVEDIDINLTELGGVKEAVFKISGRDTYGLLKYESGVHRVQRVPETEAQGRVHTSTVTVAVLPEAEDITIEINEKDLKIDTYRSGGAGGQHVNKTESAIRITHLPSGIVVQCQDERSQMKNRDKAMSVLKTKLYDLKRAEADKQYSDTRKNQVGTGDRSERIRTYNFPQGRVTDHRIGFTLYSIESFMNGALDEMLEALRIADQTARLESEE